MAEEIILQSVLTILLIRYKKSEIMFANRYGILAKGKVIAIIPLALIYTVCFSQKKEQPQKESPKKVHAKAQQRLFDSTGNTVNYRGAQYEMSKPGYDTIMEMDWNIQKKVPTVVPKPPHPVSMNGRPIMEQTDTKPVYKNEFGTFKNFLLHALERELRSQLSDGMYTLGIYNIVVDEDGRVAYFNYSGLQGLETKMEIRTGTKAVPVSNELQQLVFNIISSRMERLVFTPATKNGRPVLSVVTFPEFRERFKMSHHEIFTMDKSMQFIPMK